MIRKFLRLPSSKRLLLVEAGLLLVGVQIGIRALSYAKLRRLLGAVLNLSELTGSGTSRETIRWAVNTADNLTPGEASCLERALVAEQLLARRGREATLRFGVDIPGREMTAHAWIESGDEVVVGGGNLSKFTNLEPCGK